MVQFALNLGHIGQVRGHYFDGEGRALVGCDYRWVVGVVGLGPSREYDMGAA
jgi:hypothetical protein